jgi:hypothetical protein
MSNKIKQFDPKRKNDTIAISDALELSGLHSKVAENTSEIKKLKELVYWMVLRWNLQK